MIATCPVRYKFVNVNYKFVNVKLLPEKFVHSFPGRSSCASPSPAGLLLPRPVARRALRARTGIWHALEWAKELEKGEEFSEKKPEAFFDWYVCD